MYHTTAVLSQLQPPESTTTFGVTDVSYSYVEALESRLERMEKLVDKARLFIRLFYYLLLNLT